MKNKIFGTQTGMPASELVLGAASFGSRRGYGAVEEDIPAILAAYTDAGGNFIDLADQYQLGEAEEIVGKFIKSKRDSFVICTKYTRSSETEPKPIKFGNHRKAMRDAVDASLIRLKTDYIDVYMPHFDDGITPLDEIARGLEDLVKSGKVLYTGLANFPAWKAAAIASSTPLAALQIEFNLVQRTAERELTGMANYFGLGLMLYSPLAGGILTGKYRKGEPGRLTVQTGESFQENSAVTSILNELEIIANELNISPGQVALAWVITRNAFPIIGARTLSQMKDSLNALNVCLSKDQLAKLDSVSEISLGYPQEVLKAVQRVY